MAEAVKFGVGNERNGYGLRLKIVTTIASDRR
jgi:hypothetical protein